MLKYVIFVLQYEKHVLIIRCIKSESIVGWRVTHSSGIILVISVLILMLCKQLFKLKRVNNQPHNGLQVIKAIPFKCTARDPPVVGTPAT